MPKRYLTLDDIRNTDSPDQVVALFQKLGYNTSFQPLAIDDLQLSPRSGAVIKNAYLIADQGDGKLQVLLFELRAEGFSSPKTAKGWMAAIAQNLRKYPANFLLLSTQDYKQLLLVNSQQSSKTNRSFKTTIKCWLIDLINPSFYDRHRLEALGVVTSDPKALYNFQCQTFDLLNKQLPRPRRLYSKDSLRSYLQEIGQIQLLKADEVIELARKVDDLQELELVRDQLLWELERNPSDKEWAEAVNMSLLAFRHRLHIGQRARYKMIVSNLRLVVSISKRFRNQGLDFQDLIQEGNLGLIQAVEKFDLYTGYKFSTYATWWIRQAIIRAIQNQARTVRLPAHLYESISRIKKNSQHLFQELGREATEEEIATHMNMTIKQIQLIMKSAQPILYLESLTPIDFQDSWVGSEEKVTVGELIESDSETPEEYVYKNLLREDLESALDILTPREKDVLGMRYGLYNGCLNTVEIGVIFDLTRQRIRLIEAKALKKLRHSIYKNLLKCYLDSESDSCLSLNKKKQSIRPTLIKADLTSSKSLLEEKKNIYHELTKESIPQLTNEDKTIYQELPTAAIPQLAIKDLAVLTQFISSLDGSTRAMMNSCTQQGKVELFQLPNAGAGLLIVCPNESIQKRLKKRVENLTKKISHFLQLSICIYLSNQEDPITFDNISFKSGWVVEKVFPKDIGTSIQMKHKSHNWVVLFPSKNLMQPD